MLPRQMLVMFAVTLASLLGGVACGTPAMQGAVATLVAASTPGHVEGNVVDATPLSPTELAAQPPGTSEAGAGTEAGGTPALPTPQGEPPQPGTMDVYADSTYKFSVSYPADFVFRPQPAEKLKQLTPMPTAAFSFMNPVTASSNVPDEPADLEIRVYKVEPLTSLDRWLTLNGLVPADGSVALKPFETANVSGVEVCASTMIAPGCSYFFLGGDWGYQLTPAAQAGETIVRTFRLLP